MKDQLGLHMRTLSDYVACLEKRRTHSEAESVVIPPKEQVELDGFLAQYSLTYQDVLSRAPTSCPEPPYGYFRAHTIIQSVFSCRARLCLLALKDFQEHGGRVEEILDKIRAEDVPYVKDGPGRDQTFEIIYSLISHGK